MIIKAKIDNQKIIDLAAKKIEIDNEITKIIQQANTKFSRKKLVADLPLVFRFIFIYVNLHFLF